MDGHQSKHSLDLDSIETDRVLSFFRDHPEKLKLGAFRLAVDFDHTLAHAENSLKGTIVIPDSIRNTVERLHEQGWIIIIHTARFDRGYFPDKEVDESIEFVRRVMEQNRIAHDAIWRGEGKPLATWYLDDRSLPPFCGWVDAGIFLTGYMDAVNSLWRSHFNHSYTDAMFDARYGDTLVTIVAGGTEGENG